MKLLLDTHILLWAVGTPERLSPRAFAMIDDPDAEPMVSAASLWEVAIKAGLAGLRPSKNPPSSDGQRMQPDCEAKPRSRKLEREDFQVDPAILRRGLLEHGYTELPISGAHATAVARLPHIHKDPFDRILVAQAQLEGITLLTTDAIVARYPAPILHV